MNKTSQNIEQVSIEIMMEEHQVIKRMLGVIRKIGYQILKGREIDFTEFEKIIDFVRQYADAHHHGKEEQFLFAEMERHLGEIGIKLIRNGMYVEHDFGRLYIKDLEDALKLVEKGNEESKLDVIANAISYTHLLERHIAKEDEVIYLFGQRKLSKEILEEIDKKTYVFEENAKRKGIQEKYLLILKELEEKYTREE